MPRVLLGCIGSEGFAGGASTGTNPSFTTTVSRMVRDGADAEAEPDAEGREKNGNERTVELDGMLDDDETVFGVLQGSDEEAAHETEDENVTLHGGF